MRSKKNVLFLISIITLLVVVMLSNQRQIYAEQTAVTATGNWSTPVVLTDENDNSVTPVLRQDSTGNLIVVYISQLGGDVNYTPFNRMWNGSTWTTQDSIHDGGGDSATPDVVYDTNDFIHAVWVNDQEQLFYADQSDWPSIVDGVPASAAAGISESAVAIDSSNRLHVVWLQVTTIYYAIYENNSWSTPEIISEGTGISASLPPAIAIDDSDTVHVVWRAIGSGGIQLAYKHTQAGESFSSSYTSLSGTVPSPYSPFLLADGNRVHLSFTNFTDTTVPQQLYYVELTNSGGWSGTAPVAIGDTFFTNVGTGSSYGSASNMITCGDALHLFYYGNTLSGSTERIWQISQENGLWETEPTAVTVSDDSKRAINPYAACNGSSLHLVYEEVPGSDPHTINYIYSSNSVYLPVILK